MPQRIPMNYYSVFDDHGNSVTAEATAAIASAAATTTVKNAPGRVISALVTTAGTGGDNATITDGPSGTVLAVILGSAAVGAQVTIGLPAAVGITVVNVASGPAFTVGYN
jgi:hypothetical protein